MVEEEVEEEEEKGEERKKLCEMLSPCTRFGLLVSLSETRFHPS